MPSPRLLLPSGLAEARRELERVGAEGSWPGPLGPLFRGASPRQTGSDPVALKWPEPVPTPIRAEGPGPGVRVVGEPGRGCILFGPLDAVHEALVALGEEAAGALSALRFGAGLEMPDRWEAGGFTVPLEGGVRLMAVLNLTEDSFYEESRITDPEGLGRAIEAAVEGGADLLDVGGESTRPGAEAVPDERQVERVVPAVKAAAATGLPVSVDTTSSGVARAALDAGATVINDISAGTEDPGMFELAAGRETGLVLMHRRGSAATMQDDPRYEDLCGEILDFLEERCEKAVEAGVAPQRLCIDPGLGFGKRRLHNFELYRRMAEFHALGYPLLVGPSRKRHTSGPGDLPAGERLMGTAAACALLAAQGVQVLRVHDVGEMRRVTGTADEIRGALVEDRVS